MKKRDKSLYILIAVIIIVALSAYFYDRSAKRAVAPTLPEQQSQEQQQAQGDVPAGQQPAATSTDQDQPLAKPNQNQTPSKPTQSTYSSGEEGGSPDILVVEVAYDGNSFSPATVDIQVGDVIVFRNNSQASFWPASDPHPVHTAYPEFDAGKTIAPGGKYQFQFTQAGNWGYHNHLNPAATGIVNVTKK